MMGRAGLAILVAAGAMLLALGLAACGGGGDSSSTDSSTETSAQGPAKGSSGNGSKSKTTGKGKQNGGGKSSGSGGGSSGSDKPIHHRDSGGGSAQYRVKGGDNSVQDFGSEADTSERDQATGAVHAYLDARANQDWTKACTYLAAPVVEQFESLAEKSKQLKGKGCGPILEALASQANPKLLREEAAQANVGSLRIEDERAFVIFRGIEKTIYTIPMIEEDGQWLLGSVAPTPLT